MPIYIYQCQCGVKEEIVCPMEERNNPLLCRCGLTMGRLMSPFNTTRLLDKTERITGRDKVLKTLNREDGYRLPAREKDRLRMERAFARGLDSPKTVIGKGF